MTDTYIYLIREKRLGLRQLPARRASPHATEDDDATFGEHQDFQAAVAELGARIVGGNALQSAKYGGVVHAAARATPRSRTPSTPTAPTPTPAS